MGRPDRIPARGTTDLVLLSLDPFQTAAMYDAWALSRSDPKYLLPNPYDWTDMIVAGDGYAYLAYTYLDNIGHLKVLRVSSSGAYSQIGVFDVNGLPYNMLTFLFDNASITNADNGIFLSWWWFSDEGFGPSVPHLTRISGGGASDVTGPSITGQNQVPISPKLQLQDGSFIGLAWVGGYYAPVSQLVPHMVAFDASGAVRWSVPNEEPAIATADGGVIGKSGIIYDQNGSATGLINPLTYSWLGNAYQVGSVDQVLAWPIDFALSFWAFAGGNQSGNSASVRGWFPSLAHCTTTPGCIGPNEAIYNALSDLLVRLADPNVSALAQTKVFDKLGNDANGNRLTTQRFIAYLRNKKPSFYDGIRSSYCFDALTSPFLGHFCTDWNIFLSSVATRFQNNPDVQALTATPRSPLLTFFRPSFILYNNLGRNLGNETTIFHEALHGLTGLFDLTLQGALGGTGGICGITPYLQDNVLSHSPGLDPTTSCH